MSEELKKEKKKTESKPEISSSLEKTAVIIIGGKERTVKKMKAGRYFECQKLFLDMISEIHKMNAEIESSRSKTVEQRKKEGIKEVTFWDIMSVAPEKMMVFIAGCLEVPTEFLEAEANPEEIPEAYSKLVVLNDFMGNIKNFVAPIRESLGV